MCFCMTGFKHFSMALGRDLGRDEDPCFLKGPEEDTQRIMGLWTEHSQHGGLALRLKRPKAETRLPWGPHSQAMGSSLQPRAVPGNS